MTAPSAFDLERESQVKLFSKLAADQNIDLTKMPEAEVLQLFQYTFPKTAGEMPPAFAAAAAAKAEGGEGDDKKKDEEESKKKDEEKKEAALRAQAQADLTRTKTAHAEVEWARQLGVEMARSFREEVARDGEKTAAAQAPAGAEASGPQLQ